jgi:DNA-binding Lrp family transcriptional regulator
VAGDLGVRGSIAMSYSSLADSDRHCCIKRSRVIFTGDLPAEVTSSILGGGGLRCLPEPRVTPSDRLADQLTEDLTVKITWDRSMQQCPFEAGIAALDDVVECRRMFGLPDYVVRVAVADQAAYEAFYMNQLAELPGLARVNSQFTMKTVKPGGALPL